MWNELVDVETTELSTKDEKKGFLYNLKKYKNFLYAFIVIFILYILFVLYYESSEKNAEKDIDCSVLDEKCKNFSYPEFNPNTLFVVDTNLENNNHILRSNVPIFEGKFSEEKLMEHIKKALKSVNLNYKDDYSLNIISLVTTKKQEFCCYASEKCYASKAKIDHQLIVGYKGDDPYDLDELELDNQLKNLNWNTDDLLYKIKNLHDNFMNMKNTIFLIHCKAGKDRTGEYVGAYRMIVKKHNFYNVIRDNSFLGEMKSQFIKMQKWICLYLEKVLNYSDMNCFDYKYIPKTL